MKSHIFIKKKHTHVVKKLRNINCMITTVIPTVTINHTVKKNQCGETDIILMSGIFIKKVMSIFLPSVIVVLMNM